MENQKADSVLKNILVKEGGNWREFLTPVHKKILPAIIPSLVLGFIFYNLLSFFMKAEFIHTLKGKMFVTAVVFVYFWLVILFFMISSLVYTIIEIHQKMDVNVMTRLKSKE